MDDFLGALTCHPVNIEPRHKLLSKQSPGLKMAKTHFQLSCQCVGALQKRGTM